MGGWWRSSISSGAADDDDNVVGIINDDSRGATMAADIVAIACVGSRARKGAIHDAVSNNAIDGCGSPRRLKWRRRDVGNVF